jgi:hypothetical protein
MTTPTTASIPDLTAKYTLLRLSVISSTAIVNRTTALIAHLKSSPPDSKPAVVALNATSHVANKLISIVEIAKRNLKDAGLTVYQYNALGSDMVESKPKPPVNHTAANAEAMTDQDTPAFQDIEQKTTIRNTPTMTTYLSLLSIKLLKDAYGYAFVLSPTLCSSG